MSSIIRVTNRNVKRIFIECGQSRDLEIIVRRDIRGVNFTLGSKFKRKVKLACTLLPVIEDNCRAKKTREKSYSWCSIFNTCPSKCKNLRYPRDKYDQLHEDPLIQIRIEAKTGPRCRIII